MGMYDCGKALTEKKTKIHNNSSENNPEELDASAVSLQRTHVLTTTESSPSAAALGCCVVDVTRNDVGEDDNAGDIVVASIELQRIRIWKFDDATGTSAALASPRLSCNSFGVVCIALGLLDGTIAIVSTGVATPNKTNHSSLDTDPKCAAGGKFWMRRAVWGLPFLSVWHGIHCNLQLWPSDDKMAVSISYDPKADNHNKTIHAVHATR
jgi:hypothetical protein